MSEDLDLAESVTQASKSHIIIEMSNNIKSPTKGINRTEVTHQAVFEDLDWEPKVLETRVEKQAEWKKNAEWMAAETVPNLMTEVEKAEAKRQRQKELAPKHQHKCWALIKEQKPKPKEHRKNINTVHQSIWKNTQMQHSNLSAGDTSWW